MAKKMLIDATHPEETRVVVVDGNKVDEFDFESINKRQLSGNIYLAKITRVEPSLQAAFVDYGGNRHGFLPFSEIHPDYYQIPVADRQALLEEEERTAREEKVGENSDEDDDAAGKPKRPRRSRGRKAPASAKPDEEVAGLKVISVEDSQDAEDESDIHGSLAIMDSIGPASSEHDSADTEIVPETTTAPSGTTASKDKTPEGMDAPLDESEKPKDSKTMPEGAGLESEQIVEEIENVSDQPKGAKRKSKSKDTPAKGSSAENDTNQRRSPKSNKGSGNADGDKEYIESIGAEDLQEEAAASRARHNRNYKIQDVIKVRQIMLIQVVKEERGNKGAALTTYLSLAGRYCVFMPNTARGGGISRKITQAGDRKRLRNIMDELDISKGMGLIVRTAGAERTRAEIKRDYEFLSRQWEQTRSLTMESIAPCLIYEEGSLLKRSIRDLYSKDIDTIFVEGENGYREAKDYMKMLMPSHTKNVQQYIDKTPLFIRHQVESTLNGIFSPTVQLKSGGYIVIGLTEALVAIDVNSGRATKQGSIEETALQTNLEAAEEVARQCRLRDLAGLIVIDFIDMDENRNNRAVEKRLKECLKTDRARIQIGRISSFGLLEMSRQRMRPGMLEATTSPCRHCQGMGIVRSDENVALSILRVVEEEGARKRPTEIRVTAPVEVANFLLNRKRIHIAQIEERYCTSVLVVADQSLTSPDFSVERVDGSRQGRHANGKAHAVVTADSAAVSNGPGRYGFAGNENDEKPEEPSRRRGQRGGRKKRNNEASQVEEKAGQSDARTAPEASEGGEKKKRSRRRRRRKNDSKPEIEDQSVKDDAASGKADVALADSSREAVPDKVQPPEASDTTELAPTPELPEQPKRRGWWSFN